MSIRNKLIFLSAIFLIVPMLILLTTSFLSAKDNLNQLGMVNLQNNVRSSIQIISVLDEEVKKGNLSLQEAQEIAKEKITGEIKEGLRVNTALNLGTYGNVFILDQKGTSIADTIVELEGVSFWDAKDSDGEYFTRDIIHNATNGGGFTSFSWQLPDKEEVKEKIVYSEIDPHWGWVINAGNFLMEFDSGSKDVLKTAFTTIIFTFIIGIFIITILSKSITRPIIELGEQVKKVAEGDLSFQPKVYPNRKDEIGQLSRDFTRMVENMKNLVTDIQNSAEQVTRSSKELATSVDQTSCATEKIATTIEQVATSADHQVSSIQEITATIENISNTITNVAENTETVNQSTYTSIDNAKSGNETITIVKQQMNSIDQQVQSLSTSIQTLGNRSIEIGKIIEVITGIADQTNLLSLNAAIEAARAGTNGQGFAVVAEEIRKLATQSAVAAQRVGEIITLIQNETNQAVSAMDGVITGVKQGVVVVGEAGQSFVQIQESILDVAKQIEMVSTSIQNIHVGAEQVVTSIQRISQLVEETSNSSQGVSQNAEEQASIMEEITTSTTSLSSMAMQLKEMIRKFKV